MDTAVIGAQSFIGANSFIKTGFDVPARHLAAGSPAKVIRELTDAELTWKAQGTRTIIVAKVTSKANDIDLGIDLGLMALSVVR